MTAEIRAFFDQYRDAFNRLDGEAIAGLYAVPSGIASDAGYTHWPQREPIRDNMAALCGVYRGNGFVEARYTPGTFLAQGDDFAVADLAWEIDWSGQPPSRFNTTYNLMRTPEGWRVLLCTAYSETRFWKDA